MSNKPNFYVQGLIEPGKSFYIAAKVTAKGTTVNPAIFATGSGVVSDDVSWSMLGVQEKYVDYDDEAKENNWKSYKVKNTCVNI